MQKRHYESFIDEYVEFTLGHEATTRIHKWSIISVLAATMERRFWINRGHYILYPNLYVFIIGKSGLIKKSTSTGIAVNLLRELDGIRMISERMTAASLIHQLAECGKDVFIDGKKTKQSALFAYASELSVFLDDVFGSTTELLTTFYDCIPHDSSKPWIHRTVGGGEVRIYGPCLNILGASTKSWLRKCIPRSEMEGGFTSRCVFVVENAAPNPIAWPTVTVENEARRLRLVDDLKHIYSLSGEMKCSPKARDMFTIWYNTHMRYAVPNNPDPAMSGYLARKGDLILKLGMIRSISCRDDLVVEEWDLDWGMTEIDKIEANWRMAFDGLSVQPGLAFRIKDYVVKRIRVPKTQVYAVFGSDNPSDAVDFEIECLLDRNEITEEGEIFTYPGAPSIA